MRKYLIFLSFLWPVSHLLAQLPSKFFWEKYTVAKGLPEETITSITQDDQGFVWITTQNGLLKYDGYNFQTFGANHQNKEEGSLQLRFLQNGMIKGKNGKLWMGTVSGGAGQESGLASYDPKSQKFTNYLYDPDQPSRIPYLGGIPLLEDHLGNLWFATGPFREASLSFDTLVLGRLHIASGNFYTYPSNFSPYPNRYSNHILGNGFIIDAGTDRGIWRLDGDMELCRWDAESDTFKKMLTRTSMLERLKDTISAIAPSSNGHLILSGAKGIYIWNTSKAKVKTAYTNDTDNPNSLAAEPIRYGFEDTRGNYWVSQLNHTWTLIQPKENRVQHFVYGEGAMSFSKGSKNKQDLKPIAMDSLGLWMRGEPDGIYLYFEFSSESFHYYDQSFNTGGDRLPQIGNFQNFPSTLLDYSGVLWLGFRPNLYKQKLRKSQMALYQHSRDDPSSLPSNNIQLLFEDSQENLWIGTQRGLARYNDVNDQFEVFQHQPGDSKSISNNSITYDAMVEDSNGSIWVGTLQGLNKWNAKSNDFERFFYSEGKQRTIIACLMEDQQKRLWVSIWHEGVFVLDINSGQIIKTFRPNPEDPKVLPTIRIKKIFQDSRGHIWLTNPLRNNFGLCRYVEDEDRFVSYSHIFGDSTSLSSNAIRMIFEDAQNRLWVVADGGMLHQYDYQKDQFIQYPNLKGSFENYAFTSNKYLWLGTYGGKGLIQFTIDSLTTKAFGEQSGLLHNDISFSHNIKGEITLDNAGNLWLPNQRGLSVFNTQNHTFTNYFEEDGFQLYDRYYRTLLTRNGTIWIGGKHGLNKIIPEQLIQKNPISPKVWITGMKIMDDSYSVPDGEIFEESVPFTKEIRLKHWQKDITFEFVALHFLDSKSNQYAWKLENYDATYNAPSYERSATYTNLSPGKYTFQVKAANADGVWNKDGVGAALKVYISPPWWATWWAYCLYGLMILAILMVMRRYELSRYQTKAEAHRLKELDSVKTKLYTNITHEFRTPLTIILGMVRQIRTDPKKWYNEGLEMIHRNGRQLLQLINQMLDLSKLDNGKLDLHPQPGEMVNYLNYLVQAFESFAGSKNIQLHFLSEVESLEMDYDPSQWSKVVSNLLSNAIKFTPEGGNVYLSLRQLPSAPALKGALGTVEISVKDTGQGISEENLPFIFDRFYQIENGRASSLGGTGIGLSLVKELVELMEGKIQVQSKRHVGTTFTIHLPIYRSAKNTEATKSHKKEFEEIIPPMEASALSAQQSKASLPPSSSATILLIEDNPDVMRYLASCLESTYYLEYATNGREGVEMAIELTPDLIISDVMMPEMDGYQVTETLKNDERTSHIPILLLTAKADRESRIEGLKQGADAYLPKPFDPKELEIRLKSLIQLRQKLQSRYASLTTLLTSNDPAFQKQDAFMDRFRTTIESHMEDETFGILQIARKMKVSRTQLHNKLKALTGKSTSQVIRSIRLQKARTLLLTSKMNVSEVAYAVGFKNTTYFSSSFSEEFGLPPSELKNQDKHQ